MIRTAIKKALVEKGITQRELAENIGVWPSNLSLFLRGETLPLEAVEKALVYLELEVTQKSKPTVTVVIDGEERVIEVRKVDITF